MQLPAIITGAIFVEDLSGFLSVCGRSMVGVTVAVLESIIDLVLTAVALDGIVSVGQSIRKK